MDIFGENSRNQDDEFEFKPLTQGLGFHKKTVDLSTEVKKTSLTTQAINSKHVARAPAAPTPLEVQAESVRKKVESFPVFDQGLAPQKPSMVTQPLSREERVPFKSPRISGLRFEETQSEIVESTPPSIPSHLDFTQTAVAAKSANPTSNKISREPLPIALQENAFSIPAFIFDIFMVTGLSFLFTGIVLAVTKSDFNLVLTNAQSDIPTRISLALLFLAVIQLYMILSRSFFGSSIGEWAFDIRLGNEQQQKAAWYPILVAWRALIIMATGFITLPLLSLIVRRDLTAFLTGLRTYRIQ